MLRSTGSANVCDTDNDGKLSHIGEESLTEFVWDDGGTSSSSFDSIPGIALVVSLEIDCCLVVNVRLCNTANRASHLQYGEEYH